MAQQRPLLLIALVGVGIILLISVAGYYLGKFVQNITSPSEQPLIVSPSPSASPVASATPEPTATPTPAPTAEPSPTPRPRTTVPTAPVYRPVPRPTVKGTTVPVSTPMPVSYPTPSWDIPQSGEWSSTSHRHVDSRIDFVSLPSHVHAGDTFTIKFRVLGTEGKHADRITFRLKSVTEQTAPNAHQEVTVLTEQNFNNVELPRTFRVQFATDSTADHLDFSVEGEDVNGTDVRESRTIEIDR